MKLWLKSVFTFYEHHLRHLFETRCNFLQFTANTTQKNRLEDDLLRMINDIFF